MSTDRCRVCAKDHNTINSLKIFERVNRMLLKQLKKATGVMFKQSKQMPDYICTDCQLCVHQATDFRTNCRRAQNLLRELAKTENNNIQQETGNNNDVCDAEMHDECPQEIFPNKPNAGENILHIEESQQQCEQRSEIFNIDEKSILLCETISEELSIDALNPFERKDMSVEPLEQLNLKIDAKMKCNDSLTESPTGNEPIFSIGKEIKGKVSTLQKKSRHTKSVKMSKAHKNVDKNKTNEKEAKYVCHLCGASFFVLTYYTHHMNRHKGEKTFECTLCPKKFYTQQMLKRHGYYHSGERPYGCSFCNRKFVDNGAKVKHESGHINARNFVCTECGRGFNRSYVLKNHMLTHTGVRNFSCELCKRSFLQKKHLETHYRSMFHKQNVEKSHAENSKAD